MERAREEKVKELEFYISIWKENQRKHPEDEMFFHYMQGIIDDLESKLDILTRLEN